MIEGLHLNEDFHLEEELKKLPGKPGVYIMHGRNDEIIYVGKAVSLKNRVRQYFQSSRKKRLKIYSMLPQVSRFEYIVTDSEVEALVLECNLIKENRPKYNTMLMDDKAYPFIKVTVNEAFPRVLYAHKMKKDKAQYYGPYPDATAAKETVDLVKKLYSIRNCQRKLPADIGKDRPCLYYHIHQCKAPCQGWVSEEEYGRQVAAARDFLNGKTEDVLVDLKAKMADAAQE
ncbi:MAG: GIY-YIG nuclease family protein, partial [Eubacterium sp.]|nr:GIY-YIG nuclease family protein [Eubacterium sp.]